MLIPGEDPFRRELTICMKSENLNFELSNSFKIDGGSGRSSKGGKGTSLKRSLIEEALCLSRVSLSTVSFMSHLGSRMAFPACKGY